jgi:endogenous inhibitor of DNA gyrase (YacG/DUF329 family)
MTGPDAPAEPRRVPCPTCKRPAVFAPSNPWRPFCSERCRGVDLGAWANESYRMPVESPGPDPDAAEQAPN